MQHFAAIRGRQRPEFLRGHAMRRLLLTAVMALGVTSAQAQTMWWIRPHAEACTTVGSALQTTGIFTPQDLAAAVRGDGYTATIYGGEATGIALVRIVSPKGDQKNAIFYASKDLCEASNWFAGNSAPKAAATAEPRWIMVHQVPAAWTIPMREFIPPSWPGWDWKTIPARMACKIGQWWQFFQAPGTCAASEMAAIQEVKAETNGGDDSGCAPAVMATWNAAPPGAPFPDSITQEEAQTTCNDAAKNLMLILLKEVP
jgi:hypothetical protein